MKQNNEYYRAGAIRHRRRRSRKRKKSLIILFAAFVIMTSLTVWAMQSSAETLANGETNSNSMWEPQSKQKEKPVSQKKESEKYDGGHEKEIRPTSQKKEHKKNDGDNEKATQLTSQKKEHKKNDGDNEKATQPTSPNREREKNDDDHENQTLETGSDYAEPVPKSEMVENSYFDDAVFIGDSRTEGLILNTGLSNAISYANKGLMVDTVFTRPVINKNGQKLSVMDALRQTDFSKVYIMLGINETGWPYDNVFIEKYGKVIDEMKDINPQAIIYVQEILPVANSVSKSHSYVKNEKINAFNTLIRQMAEEKQIHYIDAGNAVSDANGCLPEEAAVDGIHLKQAYCVKWLDYLKTHTVTDRER